MLSKKTTNDYVNEVAKEFGITKKAARQILMFGMKNICRMIKKGEDIQLQHFGSIYFNKKAYSMYISKLKKSGINKSSGNSFRTTNNK